MIIYNLSILKRIALTIGFLLAIIQSNAQIPEELKTVKKENFGNDSYYLELNPKVKPLGLVIIFPGLFDHPYSIFLETSIAQQCVNNGYLVMIPLLSKDNNKFDLSLASMKSIDVMINDLIISNKEDEKINTIIGGFSIGGTRAISFYNYNFKKLENKRKISSVFAIDPPLDFNRLILSDSRKGSGSLSKLLQNEVGESTKLDSNILKNYSVFSYNFTTPESLPDFIETKLRIYSEPDIAWYLQKRKMDFYDMNIIDIAAFINVLKIKNINNKVELIVTENKGFRKGTNEKHPHSWSILDVKDFLNWIR